MEPLPSLSSSLYCAEDADDVASWDAADAWVLPSSPSSEPRVIIFPSALHDPGRPISDLFTAELEHMPRTDYVARFQDGSIDTAARLNAINWILETLPKGVGWPWQLLSVACLSVAAKMEETHVPLLVDLQTLEPRFVFEPRTVRRMEMLLMAALWWRMRSVTPFDFVDHFAGLLHVDCPGREDHAPLFCRASDLILGTHRVVDFIGYRPSEIAAAAVLCASGGKVETIAPFYDVVSKETVDGCRQLMDLHLADTRPTGAPAGPEPPMPQSPAGVLDAAACGSCDSQKSSCEAAPDPEPSGAEPPSKRRRLSPIACTDGSKCTSLEDVEDL